MADVDDTSLGLAIDHVRAIRDIHDMLTGIEWDAGTIERVAEVITDLGYDIKGPDEYVDPEVWNFQATISMEYEGDEIVSVTVLPNMGDAGNLADRGFYRTQGEQEVRTNDGVNEDLAKYLAGISHTREDGREVFQLSWEG